MRSVAPSQAPSLAVRILCVVLIVITLLPAGAVGARSAVPLSSQNVQAGQTGSHMQSTRMTAQYPHHLQPNSSRPVNSTLGYFNGYWYNSSLHITPQNGLNHTELQAYVDRVMARDELIFHRNYKNPVPVSIISRKTYRSQYSNTTLHPNSTYSRWNNDIWRASFIVGKNQNIQRVLNSYYGGHVLGFYAPRKNHIDLITPSGSSAYIDPPTLAHELTHAMQDQYYNISRRKYSYSVGTQDHQLGIKGLLEGQADYVKDVYHHECQSGQWSCLTQKSNQQHSKSNSRTTHQPNYGVQWVLYFPYAKGPGYVNALRQQRGWSAVYHRFAHPPTNSATIIQHHPVNATPLHVAKTARNGWQRYHSVGVNGSDSVGEATIFSMLWWQSYKYNAGIIPRQRVTQNQSIYDHFNFTSAASAGWSGDKITPYHKQGASGDGYVWQTAWKTPAAAKRFASAYRKIMDAHNAAQNSSFWNIPGSDPYSGTYRIVLNQTRVTIVEGPSKQAVRNIRPTIQKKNSVGAISSPTSSSSTPGFGVGVALIALTILGLFWSGRSRT